ncbi:MAG TPA: hypothetical protein ENG74_02495 [Thermoplasmatales archaeon]|nr:hypothetical protein [Thermoplasmatales archaeon]
MKAKCRLEMEFKDSKIADIIMRSIKVDDYNFVKSKTDGNKLIAEIEAKSVSSLLHTIDDYLACVTIAEKVVDKD